MQNLYISWDEEIAANIVGDANRSGTKRRLEDYKIDLTNARDEFKNKLGENYEKIIKLLTDDFVNFLAKHTDQLEDISEDITFKQIQNKIAEQKNNINDLNDFFQKV